jgi:hypothetical protein
MNKTEFIRRLKEHSIVFWKHGTRHEIFVYTPTGKKVTISRRREYTNLFLKEVLKEVEHR